MILKPEAYAEWLDPDNKEPAKNEELLKTAYAKKLNCYSVSKRVNWVENKSKECMEPLEGIGGPKLLESALKKV